MAEWKTYLKKKIKKKKVMLVYATCNTFIVRVKGLIIIIIIIQIIINRFLV